ncbi:MAG TPA: 4-hydroxy-3-methylbut-2-enyl diphosphate reductase [Candidatus Eremiobacteraeota bacterium]|nr:4-hydroxy-3-methylbut-2-enyl diphosphate reductase [Candidatus Eremiobacteraeota bacterium]
MSKNEYKIIKSRDIGFCSGVNRAVKMTEKALQEGKRVYIAGELIHNPRELKRLQGKGLQMIESLEEAKGGTLIIRSHGISPGEYNRATAIGMEIIDATCPYVKKLQDMASLLNNEGYKIVIIGEASHPEVQGIVGYAPGAVVISKREEIEGIKIGTKVGLLIQTTQKIGLLQEIVSYILPGTFELKIFNTICNATEKRQKATYKLAREVDIMIVIGGKNSSNTNKLVSISRDTGVKTYHIETSSELKDEWFSSVVKIGVTGGASTPTWLIDEIVEKIEELCQKRLEQ